MFQAESCYVCQAGLELTVLCLSQPSKCCVCVTMPTAPRSLDGLYNDTLTFIFLDLFYLMCMSFAYKYVCVPCACLVPLEVRRRHWIPRNQRYRWL